MFIFQSFVIFILMISYIDMLSKFITISVCFFLSIATVFKTLTPILFCFISYLNKNLLLIHVNNHVQIIRCINCLFY